MDENHNNEAPVYCEPPDAVEVLKEFVPVFVTEVVLTGLMLAVYAASGRWSVKVLLGGLLGTAAELVNFMAMTFSLLRAEQAETPKKGQVVAKGNYLVRMFTLLAVLVAALASDLFDPVATLLPLCFMRLALFAANFRKKKKKEAKD